MTKYTVKFTTQFKKDYKAAVKRGYGIELLNEIISKLANGEALAESTGIIISLEIGQGLESAIFFPTGC